MVRARVLDKEYLSMFRAYRLESKSPHSEEAKTWDLELGLGLVTNILCQMGEPSPGSGASLCSS